VKAIGMYMAAGEMEMALQAAYRGNELQLAEEHILSRPLEHLPAGPRDKWLTAWAHKLRTLGNQEGEGRVLGHMSDPQLVRAFYRTRKEFKMLSLWEQQQGNLVEAAKAAELAGDLDRARELYHEGGLVTEAIRVRLKDCRHRLTEMNCVTRFQMGVTNLRIKANELRSMVKGLSPELMGRARHLVEEADLYCCILDDKSIAPGPKSAPEGVLKLVKLYLECAYTCRGITSSDPMKPEVLMERATSLACLCEQLLEAGLGGISFVQTGESGDANPGYRVCAEWGAGPLEKPEAAAALQAWELRPAAFELLTLAVQLLSTTSLADSVHTAAVHEEWQVSYDSPPKANQDYKWRSGKCQTLAGLVTLEASLRGVLKKAHEKLEWLATYVPEKLTGARW
jgi:hypothetical protein